MISGIITSILLVLFLGGWLWAWSPRRDRDFEAAARLPLDELSEATPEEQR
jgi:cytochrome c oxidase cbb3-type subunit 4